MDKKNIFNTEYNKDLTRNNHYVPQWYQKGFAMETNHLYYLDLNPETKTLTDGRVIKFNDRKSLPFSQCFFEYDLYTTFFGSFISDLIERELFGKIDDDGSRALRAFIDGNESDRHFRFQEFFQYIDAQKARTPKGLEWLKNQYSDLDQTQLMTEMQASQDINITIWYEGVREIVSAEESNIKFILSDHPVTIYNHACPPESEYCSYPNDPLVPWKASQTIFPLDKNHCLILTNLEYANDPYLTDPLTKRKNARNFGTTLVRTNAFIRNRKLSEIQVQEINYAIKKRARRFIAAAQEEWLYPESEKTISWQSIKQTLLPPSEELHQFGGEMMVGYADGTTYSQDAFGRTSKENDFFEKELPKGEIPLDDPCPCAQGRIYKECCLGKNESERPSWNILSIRERNIIFYNGINDILGLSEEKDWNDVRRELNDDQIRAIHQLFEDLWPSHTDIFSLLPKPDATLRAIYTGIIDPRVFNNYATSATLYFDQLIVCNPFVNPSGMSPEYSPLINPAKHKQQTLKNLVLFLEIFPLIYSGKIILIPDLGIFNKYLQSQSVDMSRQRHSKNLLVDNDAISLLDKLMKDDHRRTLWGLSESEQRKAIKKKNPDATEEDIAKLYNYSQEKRMQDPLTLLQTDLYKGEGQMTMMNMAPNFEITLLLAQLTGSIIFTDSSVRWKEILSTQNNENSAVHSDWSDLIDFIKTVDFPINIALEEIVELNTDDKLKKMREAWQSIFTAVSETKSENIQEVTKHLKEQTTVAIEIAYSEMISNTKDSAERIIFRGKFNFIIPTGGIKDNNVLRLIVTCGAQNYRKNVPMAIFVK